MSRKSFALLGGLILFPLFFLNGQIPRTLPFQGVYTDTLGQPKPDGLTTFTFRLYDVSAGGVALWTEIKDLQTRGGLFSTQLGDLTALPSSLQFDKPYWLGVKPGTDPELTPRIPLGTVAYSMSSHRSDSSRFSVRADTSLVALNAGAAGPAGGDLSGDYPNPVVDALLGRPLNVAVPAINQILRWNSSSWQPVNDNNHSHITQTFTGSSAGAGLSVTNTGTGDGMYVTSSGNYGIWSTVSDTVGTTRFAFYGRALSSNGIGVYGDSWHTSGTTKAIFGRVYSPSGYAIYGQSDNAAGFAGYFSGKVHVSGTLSKSAGTFKIDHPTDPENKYLQHSFVESPDMMNIYNGNVVLDSDGKASVELPEWFETLNKEYRYQLTPLGGAAPDLHIAQEVENRLFVIAGGRPGLRVSWQVTGIRDDPYARKHRIQVELEKTSQERGRFLYPELYGKSKDRAINADVPSREELQGAMHAKTANNDPKQ